MINRRQILTYASSAAAMPMTLTFSWTKHVHAEPITAITVATTGLKVGEMVTGMLGSRSAARAAALDKAATREMLMGISTAVDGITQGLSTLLEQVTELPDHIQALLLSHRSENNRASVLATYRRFLQQRGDLLRPGSNIRINEETVERYIDSLWGWLDDIRHQSGIIFETPHYNRIEPSLIMCICLRAELDIVNELEGFGFNALSFGSIAQYKKYFEKVIEDFDKIIHTLREKHQVAEASKNQYIQLATDNPSVAMIHHKIYAESSHKLSRKNRLLYEIGYHEIVAVKKPLTSYVSYFELVDKKPQTCIGTMRPLKESDYISGAMYIPIEGFNFPFLSYAVIDCELDTQLISEFDINNSISYNTTNYIFGDRSNGRLDPSISPSNKSTYDKIISIYRSNQKERDKFGYSLSSFLAAKEACVIASEIADIAITAANFQISSEIQ